MKQESDDEIIKIVIHSPSQSIEDDNERTNESIWRNGLFIKVVVGLLLVAVIAGASIGGYFIFKDKNGKKNDDVTKNKDKKDALDEKVTEERAEEETEAERERRAEEEREKAERKAEAREKEAEEKAAREKEAEEKVARETADKAREKEAEEKAAREKVSVTKLLKSRSVWKPIEDGNFKCKIDEGGTYQAGHIMTKKKMKEMMTHARQTEGFNVAEWFGDIDDEAQYSEYYLNTKLKWWDGKEKCEIKQDEFKQKSKGLEMMKVAFNPIQKKENKFTIQSDEQMEHYAQKYIVGDEDKTLFKLTVTCTNEPIIEIDPDQKFEFSRMDGKVFLVETFEHSGDFWYEEDDLYRTIVNDVAGTEHIGSGCKLELKKLQSRRL